MVTNSLGNKNFIQPMGRLSMYSKCLEIFLGGCGGLGLGVGSSHFCDLELELIKHLHDDLKLSSFFCCNSFHEYISVSLIPKAPKFL